MPIRIFHPDHGYVLTNDSKEIDYLLAKGGTMDKVIATEPKQDLVNVKPEPLKRKAHVIS